METLIYGSPQSVEKIAKMFQRFFGSNSTYNIQKDLSLAEKYIENGCITDLAVLDLDQFSSDPKVLESMMTTIMVKRENAKFLLLGKNGSQEIGEKIISEMKLNFKHQRNELKAVVAQTTDFINPALNQYAPENSLRELGIFNGKWPYRTIDPNEIKYPKDWNYSDNS